MPIDSEPVNGSSIAAAWRPRFTMRVDAVRDTDCIQQTIKSENASLVRFALEDEVHVVEKLKFHELRGDIRNPEGDDPDWCTIGQARNCRLTQFAETSVAIKALRAWSRHSSKPRQASYSPSWWPLGANLTDDDGDGYSDADDEGYSDADEFDGYSDYDFCWSEPEGDDVDQDLLEALYRACSSGGLGRPLSQVVHMHFRTCTSEVSFQRRQFQHSLQLLLRSHWLCLRSGLSATINIPCN